MLAGALIGLWLIIDAARSSPAARAGKAEGEVAAPVVHPSYDVRDHGGPVVERRGPNITEWPTRDVIDRTSGENPRR